MGSTIIYCAVIIVYCFIIITKQVQGDCRSESTISTSTCSFDILRLEAIRDDAIRICSVRGGRIIPANSDSGHLANFNFLIWDEPLELCGPVWTELYYDAIVGQVYFQNGEIFPLEAWDTTNLPSVSSKCLTAQKGSGNKPALLPSACNVKRNFTCIRSLSSCLSTCASNQVCVEKLSSTCSNECQDIPTTASSSERTDTTTNRSILNEPSTTGVGTTFISGAELSNNATSPSVHALFLVGTTLIYGAELSNNATDVPTTHKPPPVFPEWAIGLIVAICILSLVVVLVIVKRTTYCKKIEESIYHNAELGPISGVS